MRRGKERKEKGKERESVSERVRRKVFAFDEDRADRRFPRPTRGSSPPVSVEKENSFTRREARIL